MLLVSSYCHHFLYFIRAKMLCVGVYYVVSRSRSKNKMPIFAILTQKEHLFTRKAGGIKL